MKKHQANRMIKLESKRSQELWIYSFADMYMILSVFFIAISMAYAAKAKKAADDRPVQVVSAGRGLAAVESSVSIAFPQGSDLIESESIESLQLILPVIRASRSAIDVEGYADGTRLSSSSAFTSNLDLSNSRAVKVAEWLIKNGISARRIRTFSYGDAYQFNSKSDGVATNRRVIVKIMAPRGGS